MWKSKFIKSWIAGILKQADMGAPVKGLVCRHEISVQGKIKLEALDLDDDWNFIDLHGDGHSRGGRESSDSGDSKTMMDPWGLFQ